MDVTPPEATLAKIWQAQWLAPGPWRTADGRTVAVRYRGRWSAGFGPDFADAALTLDGREIAGAVELHRRTGDWRAHGHHLDPAFTAVVLHVVWAHEGPPALTRDGRTPPTLVLAPILAGPLARFPADVSLGGLGAAPCAHDYGGATENGMAHGDDLLRLLGRAGDSRLALKAAACEVRFAAAPPGDALYAGLLDALGYAANRAPMAALAAALPLVTLERRVLAAPAGEREAVAAATILGVAGWLDRDAPPAFLVGGKALRERWASTGGAAAVAVPATAWETARVRPANHPARRLLAMAAWLAAHPEGLTAALLVPLAENAEEPRRAVRALREALRPPSRFLKAEASPVGADRATEIAVNVVLPFALAYGLRVGDESLVAATEAVWESLPAPRDNAVTLAMREQLSDTTLLRVRTARHQQGLIALYRERCRTRRCAACPVARLAALAAALPE